MSTRDEGFTKLLHLHDGVNDGGIIQPMSGPDNQHPLRRLESAIIGMYGLAQMLEEVRGAVGAEGKTFDRRLDRLHAGHQALSSYALADLRRYWGACGFDERGFDDN